MRQAQVLVSRMHRAPTSSTSRSSICAPWTLSLRRRRFPTKTTNLEERDLHCSNHSTPKRMPNARHRHLTAFGSSAEYKKSPKRVTNKQLLPTIRSMANLQLIHRTWHSTARPGQSNCIYQAPSRCWEPARKALIDSMSHCLTLAPWTASAPLQPSTTSSTSLEEGRRFSWEHMFKPTLNVRVLLRCVPSTAANKS